MVHFFLRFFFDMKGFFSGFFFFFPLVNYKLKFNQPTGVEILHFLDPAGLGPVFFAN